MDGDQATIERADNARSARTSTRTQRVEVITGSERRRRWSIEEKREIVGESLQPGIGPGGLSVSTVSALVSSIRGAGS
jgi:transposase-like protein